MLFVGCFPNRFALGLEEEFFQRISLDAVSGNGVLQLLPLTVNTIVPMQFQFHLTCIKDEHLNMYICNIKISNLLCF